MGIQHLIKYVQMSFIITEILLAAVRTTILLITVKMYQILKTGKKVS